MKLNRETVVDVAESSIIETIEAFVRFRPGFHGDTGIRDYLYHRLMTGLPNGGTHTAPDGGGTLLAQAEWYTVLKYRNTGNAPSRGRFDIGVADPEELDAIAPRPLITFECGRNKDASVLLGDVDAAAEHDGPAPADITKLAREIKYAGLRLGYALEFYDEDPWKAERLISQMQAWLSASQCDGLRVVVLACSRAEKPSVTFLPISWHEQLWLKFGDALKRIESLSCVRCGGSTARGIRTGEGYTNRVGPEDFLSSSSPEARRLIECIKSQFHSQVKLVFGGSSMTVNVRPNGRLLRITKSLNAISEIHPAIVRELALLLHEPIPRSGYPITETDAFRAAVLAGVGKAVAAAAPLVKVEVARLGRERS